MENVHWAGNGSTWRSQARCLGTDPALFFPVGTTGDPLMQAEAAKRVCQDCEVRPPCLQFALETNQDTGVWGGTTEDERRTLRRNWMRAGRPAILASARSVPGPTGHVSGRGSPVDGSTGSRSRPAPPP